MSYMSQKSFRLIVWNELEDMECTHYFDGAKHFIREVNGYADVLCQDFIQQINITNPHEYIRQCIERDLQRE
jgi:hypothetical protein